MVLKILKKNGEVTYTSADEFSINKVFIEDIFKHFTSDYFRGHVMYYEDIHNTIVKKIQEQIVLEGQIVDYHLDSYIDIGLVERTSPMLVCCIYPKSKNKEHNMIVTNCTTYLMSDDGKTIEKIKY